MSSLLPVFYLAMVLFIPGQARAEDPHLPDRSGAPLRSAGAAEKVAKFDFPPGHVTVSRTGRIFMDALTSDPASTVRVIELKNGKMIPFPALSYQKKFKTIHGLYVDAKDRLWILDYNNHRFTGAPRIYGFDIHSGKEIENYSFPLEVAGYGSMLNDLLVDLSREKIYISDTAPISGKPGIIIFDIASRTSRRVLHAHPTVMPTKNGIYLEGKEFTILGFYHPKFGLDGIALDPTLTWFYYAAFNSGRLYRIPVSAMVDEALAPADLNKKIEKVADITMTDGMFADTSQRVYLTDVEHSSIMRVERDGRLETIFKDPLFRWPAGFSLSADGWMYFTCDAIGETKLRPRKEILARGPYYLFRFRP